MFIKYTMGFTDESVVKNLPGSAEDTGDAGSAPGLGRSHWRRKWQSTQYSCLKNAMDRGAWQAIVLKVTKSRTKLSD